MHDIANLHAAAPQDVGALGADDVALFFVFPFAPRAPGPLEPLRNAARWDDNHVFAAKASPDVFQEKLDASDIVGRWKWDIVHDRIYADAAVALLFNLEPAVARAGASLDRYLEAVHPEDRERASQDIATSLQAGRAYRQEYRVRSVDGVTRRILARGRIQRDAAGRPKWGRVLLIDVTQDHPDPTGDARPEAHQHPLPLAAEYCMAMRQALYELPEPLLRRMSDMLLLEIGRAMVRAESAEQRNQMN